MARPLVPMAPPPGRKPKDGSRALARHIAQNKIDRRTREARARQHAANLIAEDAGGWPNLNNRQAMVVWAAASTWVILSLRLDALLSGKADESEPSLKWLVAMLNSFGRYMDRLGLDAKIEDRLPSLDEYIAQRSNTTPAPESHAAPEPDPMPDRDADRTPAEAAASAATENGETDAV